MDSRHGLKVIERGTAASKSAREVFDMLFSCSEHLVTAMVDGSHAGRMQV
jgi:hypothetical protein